MAGLALVCVSLAIVVAVDGWRVSAGSGVKLNVKPTITTPVVDQEFAAELEALAVSGPGLGTWVIDLVFDPNFLAAEGCTPQASTGCGVFDTNIRFNGFTTEGLTGDIDLGLADFQAIAPGVTTIEVMTFGLSDTGGNDLTVGMQINQATITITSEAVTPTATEEPLPGLDDTPTPGETPVPTTPSPSATPTSTPVHGPTPGVGVITVSVFRNGGEGLSPFFNINVFEGDGCLGVPVLQGEATGNFFNPHAEFESDALPVGSYSVSLKLPLPEGWVNTTALCQDVILPVEGAFIQFEIGRAGDVNKDGSVNSVDGALMLQFGAGLLNELASPAVGDVNQDGAINAIDAQLTLQFSAGLLDGLPVGGD